MKSSAFWDITLYNPGKVTGLTQHHIPEDRTLHTQNGWKFAPTNTTILNELGDKNAL
jgi:hypothetical protein